VKGRVLFYVQHLLGIGHLRRALRIVDALSREGVSVTLVSGGEPLAELGSARAERIVQLPPVRSRDAGFTTLVDGSGRPIDEDFRSVRRAALLTAFRTASPDAILIEAFPFGRRAFRFELDPLIEAARSRSPPSLVVCSSRDIVVAPRDAKQSLGIVDRVRADFDRVLVHGDPAFVPLEASFPLASEIADRLTYTGYIGGADEDDGTAAAQEEVGKDEVVVSVGGGAVGGLLLSTALESRKRGCLARLKWRLLAGPNLPDAEFEALANNLPEGVLLERYRPNFLQVLRRCRVSVSQAGYNTILDILAAGTPAVVVPFATERETEQTLRAEKFAAAGVLEIVRETELSPHQLCRALDRAIDRGPGSIAITMGGAKRTAETILEMIRSPRSSIHVRARTLPAAGSGI
jgi:predicted glycosyltransferase